MKKFLIISFFVSLCLKNKAQMWCAPGAEWIYAYSQPYPSATGHLKLKYANDSTINTVVYKKILPSFIPGPPMYGSYVQFWPNHFLINENNRVLSLHTGNSGIDTIFNFNASIGDVWLRARFPQSSGCDEIRRPVTVIDTSSEIINGIKLKKLVLNYIRGSNLVGNPPPQTYSYNDTVYEKIGSKRSHLIPIVCETQSFVVHVSGYSPSGNLRCYKDDNFPYYQGNPSINCLSIPTGMVEGKNLNLLFSIFPNPTHGIINIRYGNNVDDKSEIEIRDITGRLIKTQRISGKEESIAVDLSKLENGIYFLQLFNSNKLIITKKIVKQ